MEFREFNYRIAIDGRFRCKSFTEILTDGNWNAMLDRLNRTRNIYIRDTDFLEFTIYNKSNLVLLKVLDDNLEPIKLIEYCANYELIESLFNILDKGTEKKDWQKSQYKTIMDDGMSWEIVLVDAGGDIFTIKEPSVKLAYKKKISNTVNKIIPKIQGKYNAFHFFDL